MDQNNNEPRHQPPPGVDPPAAEFTSSTWADSSYFFADANRDYSTILSEYGWSLLQDPVTPGSSSIGEEYPGGTSSVMPPSTTTTTGEVEVTGAGGTSNNCPALSSDSSEDPAADKSTGSDGNTPAETPSSNKVKKKGQKRMRQPRFAFMTKSDVDHLEDGYRWRKYGQKAVKNSPFPRSYYRCTNNKCTVKKRVERSSEDPTVVITTYEGQHCHHSVGFPRGGGGVLIPHETAAAFGPQMAPPLLPQLYHPQRSVRPNSSPREINGASLQPDIPPRPAPTTSGADSQQLPAAVSAGDSQMQHHLDRTKPPDDHPSDGLLGDIVPSMTRHR